MTHTHISTSQPQQISLAKRMLIGAGIGLLVILYFVLGANAPAEWGKYWMIQPLIVVPFAGAMGGLCNYVLLKYHSVVGVNKTIAIIFSVFVFIVGLWMGIVLGLNGTMWN